MALAAFAVTFDIRRSYGQGLLYAEGRGVNPPFSEIRDSIQNGYAGTVIDVDNASVEGGLYGAFETEGNLKLHTLANSTIPQSNFDQWSRWYQTDGATQVFRLFPGEENVRNSRPLAARVEAFAPDIRWNVDDGEWHDWVGRYTIVKPINAAIFQAKDTDDEAWSLQLNMSESGEVYAQHRRPLPGQPKQVTLFENAIGQPFDIRVRDNGLDYEVFLGDQTQPFTSGQYVRNATPGDNSDTVFRWGIYVGATEVETEALIFVSHASVDADLGPAPPTGNYSNLIAGWETWSEVSTDTWDATQASGVTAQAVGTPEAGGSWFNFTNATVANGASSDGQYGAVGPTGADPSVDSATDGVSLSNGYDGFIDFTLNDTTGAGTILTGFHFDLGAFRANAATDWELAVLAGGNLTAGALATGTATVGASPMHDDESINLTGLADNILDANGTVTFRLSFTGGLDGSGGHHLFLDNVGVTGVSLGLAGDYNRDGVVDAADYTVWRDHLGAPAGTLPNDPRSGTIGADQYNTWRNNFGQALPPAPTAERGAVPEPSSIAMLVLLVCCGSIAPISTRRPPAALLRVPAVAPNSAVNQSSFSSLDNPSQIQQGAQDGPTSKAL
ncbi:hypothetical protein Pla175_22920 [Pirellulimonas nuda]|uniref:PEP-CTERM protein-sorting domain-containing protein n=2 Tax=Pirellulimonas nuda TaxID=2528009 RepID=A0A518DBR2_9BACT|nr:hypothetical protein Pla175_22920 [Pirellulimonas nuda]